MTLIYNGYCFSDFQFSDITAVMHAMPSITGVPDFGLGLTKNY